MAVHYMKRVFISTLGCKVNQYESSAIAEQFCNLGFEPTNDISLADIIVINTCTVTNRTDYKSRNIINKAIRIKAIKPGIKIYVTGCFTQRNNNDLENNPDIDLVIDNQNKTDVARWLLDSNYRFADILDPHPYRHIPVSVMHERTRAFQKIQDGCDYYCNYCAVPYARGHSRSCSYTDVIDQAKLLVTNGYKEIVLGGVNLGLYKDNNKGLADIIEALNKISGLEIIRLSSIEPQLFSKQLLETCINSGKVAPHFHIPLQSGSDNILKRMGRKYHREEVQTLVEDILKHYPTAAIGLDVITAFPGETDQEFIETYDFINNLRICYLHVFVYSKRSGTPASKYKGQINGIVSKKRSIQLSELSQTKKVDHMNDLISKGTIVKGVVEEKHGNYYSALSNHYHRMFCNEECDLNSVVSMKVESIFEEGLTGKRTY